MCLTIAAVQLHEEIGSESRGSCELLSSIFALRISLQLISHHLSLGMRLENGRVIYWQAENPRC